MTCRSRLKVLNHLTPKGSRYVLIMPYPPHPVINAATTLRACPDTVLKMTCSRCRRDSALAVRDVDGFTAAT